MIQNSTSARQNTHFNVNLLIVINFHDSISSEIINNFGSCHKSLGPNVTSGAVPLDSDSNLWMRL